jgi:drug/metabolite transporter (DMT)-like permease
MLCAGSASVFQMLRGSIIIFTALLSKIFLGRKFYPFHYFGLSFTIIGVTLVGMSSILGAGGGGGRRLSEGSSSAVLLGDILARPARSELAIS